MIRSFLMTSCLVAMSQVSLASTGLEGTWNYSKIECKSGAPAKEVMLIVGTVFITSDQVTSDAHGTYKMDKAQGESALSQYEVYIKSLEQQPASPEKEKNIAAAKAGMETIRKYMEGIDFNVKTVNSYSVSGSVIHTEVLSYSSDFPNSAGGTQVSPVGEKSDSQFEVNGNNLRLTGAKVETSEGATCPKGDTQITVLTRAL